MNRAHARCSFAAIGAGVVAGVAWPAAAQDVAGDGSAERPLSVLVTGSHLATVEREIGYPVEVITRSEIERANLHTAAQLVATISAAMGFGAFSEAQALGDSQTGVGQAGFAAAGMRGLGYQATLILVDGRRIANFALTTLGGDLNSIPLAAIERVEVLKYGASAIYGSDAVAGVINFVLRQEYEGAEASTQYTAPEHTGGYAKRFTASAGYGKLATQRFNAYATVDYQAPGAIRARDRPFAARRYIPDEGVDATNVHSVPANVDTPAGVRNPTGDPARNYADPACMPPLSFPTAGAANQYQCRYAGDGSATIVDPSERLNVFGALTWQLARDHQLFANASHSRNRFEFVTSPTQVSSQTTLDPKSGFKLPPTSPFYPHDFARAFGIDGAPLNVYWSADPLGARDLAPTTEQLNVVAGMRGTAVGWRYDGALDYSRSHVEYRAADGYARESALLPILNSGGVDPFATNTSAIDALLATAKFEGLLATGTASTTSLDFVASKAILDLPAGEVALALGINIRRNELAQTPTQAYASGDILGLSPWDAISGARDIAAAYAEAGIPVAKSLEARLAVRYDHYSDFGGTTNPQVSLRWQPVSTLLMRASAGTGYFAPSLAGLFTPASRGLTPGNLSDPIRCPITHSAHDCTTQFPMLSGGNPGLRPTTSSQWSAGAVWTPAPGITLGADYVSILLDNRINFFTSQTIIAQCPNGVGGPTCYLIHRGPADPAYPALPGPIVQVDQFLTNLGKQKVTAIDFTARLATPMRTWGRLKISFDGTYTIQNSRQRLGGSYVNQVNHYSLLGGLPGVVPYWHHYLALDWDFGPWSATLTENFQTGGYDESPGADGLPRMIGNYDVWNLGFAYTGFRNWKISAGIQNVLDRDPPFSNQSQQFQVGYDSNYGDPHGRLYWLGVRYAFK